VTASPPTALSDPIDELERVDRTLHEMFLYCVKEKEQIKGNFITYNSYSGEIGSSVNVQHEPNVSSFPVVEILNQDLLPTDLLSRLDGL
jgi:hypothetical protein